MFVTWALWATLALAGNQEPSVRLGVVVVPQAVHPVGLEVGLAHRYLLVEDCSTWGNTYPGTSPTSDCVEPLIFPSVGPSALITWRGGARFGGFLGLIGGVGTVESHDVGFFPLWALDGRVGVGGDFGHLPGLMVGVEGGRALGYRVATPCGNSCTSFREYGAIPLALRVGARSRWGPKAGFSPPRVDVAAEMSLGSADYY